MLEWLKRSRTPKWPTYLNNAEKWQWTEDKIYAFSHWTSHKDATIDDLPQALVFQGTMGGATLWRSLDHWWLRFPEHFGMFWATVQATPRQKWSSEALTVLAKHIPVDEVEMLVATALLSDDGRAWLLNQKEYNVYLRKIDKDSLAVWAQSTVYSMQDIKLAFESLVLLHLKGQCPAAPIAAALHIVWETQNHLPLTEIKGQAWNMPTEQLDIWMDEDKDLPWWFDPVNRQTWEICCTQWAQQCNWKPEAHQPLYHVIKT